MFDNLRQEASSSPFYDDYEEEAKFQPAAGTITDPAMRKPPGRFLGMTPNQRFIIAFMLMMAVCTLGMMCLLITGRIGLSL